MTTVVFDTNSIISAIFWPRSIARRCLGGLARRQYEIALSREVFDEYETVAAEFQARFPARNSAGTLAWLRLKARWVEAAAIGKQRSRDPKDDPFLACALAAQASYLISRDEDLLTLGKPFGIEVTTPLAFLSKLRKGSLP